MESYITRLCNCDHCVNPLFGMLGLRLVEAKDQKATLTLPILPGFKQGGGVVAGGILATMADEAMAHAIMGAIDNHVVTIEMSIRYLRPATMSGNELLVAKAQIIKLGRTIVVAEAKVFKGEDTLLATAGGSFAVVDPARLAPR